MDGCAKSYGDIFKTLDVTRLVKKSKAVGMYSGIFNNPFLIWGRYQKKWFKTYLTISFQFHHTQMDGAHAGDFLERLQREIKSL